MSNSNAERVNANIRIYAYAGDVQTTTSLHLLGLVDQTIDALSYEQNRLSNHLQSVDELVLRVKSCETETEIDPEDKIQELLLSVEEGLCELYSVCKLKIDAAVQDNQLNGDHENDIIYEYQRTMDAVSRLHNANEQLRFLIMEFDADLSPVTNSFNNADDLIAHLKAS